MDEGANIHAGQDLALRWAAENGAVEAVKFLLERGANVKAWGREALRLAKLDGNSEIVKLLEESNSGTETKFPLLDVNINFRVDVEDLQQALYEVGRVLKQISENLQYELRGGRVTYSHSEENDGDDFSIKSCTVTMTDVSR